ncbi:MAG: EamA family transporter [Candidatus Gottesmanbacteria bacterium]
MDWLSLIIFSAFFFSIVDVMDKFLCSNKIKSVFAFLVITNIISVVFTSFLLFFVDFKISWGWPLFFAAISAIFYFFLWAFWLKALKKTEVSRSIAIYSSAPIYTALLAVVFLQEQLSLIKWLSIVAIIAGSILCSYEKTSARKSIGFNSMYLLVILAALFSSLGGIVSKAAMQTMHPFIVDIVAVYAAIPLFLLLFLKKGVFNEVVEVIKNKKIIFPFLIRGLLGFLGTITFYLAISLGPVSLVSAGFGGTNPLFVFGISIILSLFWPKFIKENISPQTIFQKAMAIILIVGGVVLINF